MLAGVSEPDSYLSDNAEDARMRICLFDDRRTADLGPLTLTRPASDLLCGLTSLGEKQTRYFGAGVVGRVCRPVLADWLQARDPFTPANDPDWLRSGPTILVNSRWLAPSQPTRLAGAEVIGNGPAIGMCVGEVAYAVLDTRHLRALAPTTLDDCLADWSLSLPTNEAGGKMIRYPWELVDYNPDQIRADFDAIRPPTGAGPLPPGFALVGPADRLFLHASARIDPMVVADTTNGPIWVGPGAVVGAFTRLEGPCVIGAGTHLLGAKVRAGTTLGPHCRIGGEVECSIVQGYSNKYHDGFLGHSYVGEWVNIAAGTSTGDLRCDYQPISVRLGGEVIPTGRVKVGSVIGDHTRTGLGVLLNCGTVIGAFASLLPTGQLAPRDIPSFARFGPTGLSIDPNIDAALTTAGVVMQRRGRELTPELRAVYRAIASLKAPERLPTPVHTEAGWRKSA